ncbi:MAG TPA: TraR/DksA family transcriptional regulator [Candidatus Bathyarchaeia archaeon]|nr:TraR/DksA family transcriptional regulator [Candidatus Bathyarchaeia archaeon]
MTAERARVEMDRTGEFRALLQEAQKRLLRTVATTDEELASLAAQEPGRLIEGAGRDAAEDLLARLEGRERHELDEIRAAQGRLETGAFGICETCRGIIPLPRLRAMPWARCCVTCQARGERS